MSDWEHVYDKLDRITERVRRLEAVVEAARQHHAHTSSFCGDPGRHDVPCVTYVKLSQALRDLDGAAK